MLYASPTGKSTLADSLFNTSFDSTAESHSEAGVKLKAHTYELQVMATLDCALIDGFLPLYCTLLSVLPNNF